MVNVKSPLEIDSVPWQKEDIANLSIAASFLLFSIFAMPLLIRSVPQLKLSLPDIMLFSALPGVIAYNFISAEKLPLRLLTWREIRGLLLFGLLLLTVSGCVTAAWKFVLKTLKIPFPETQEALIAIKEMSGVEKLRMFFGVCVLPPVLEELLFRRLLYGALLRLGRVPSAVLTALIFSVCHFFVAGLPGLFLLGIGFQYVYLKYRNLAAAMFLHFLVNATAFAFA